MATLTPQEAALIDAFRNVSPSRQDKILLVAEYYPALARLGLFGSVPASKLPRVAEDLAVLAHLGLIGPITPAKLPLRCEPSDSRSSGIVIQVDFVRRSRST